MYADDTNAFFSDGSLTKLEMRVNDYSNRLGNWLMANKPSMNLTKTTHIIFRPINTSERCSVVINYKNNIVKQVTIQVSRHLV